MESSDNEQYVRYSLSSVHDIQQSIISHEEVCEPEELVISSEVKTTSARIICENTSSDDESSVVYPIYIKQEETPQYTSGDDESMAVEALRQLGGMYPSANFNEKKTTNYEENQLKSLKNSEMEYNNLYTVKNQSSIDKDSANNTLEERICSVDSESGLEAHSINKNFIKFSCSTCGEKFERKLDLNNHMVCHQVDRPHACRTCGNLFRSKSSLQAHMSQVHNQEKSHKCSICGADFQRPSSLSNHMKIHTYVAGRALMSQSANKLSTESPTSSSAGQTVVHNYQLAGQINWQSYALSSDNNTLAHEKLDLQEFTVLENGEMAQFEYPQSTIYNLNFNNFTNSDTHIVKVETLPFEERKGGQQHDFVTVEVEQNSTSHQFICTHCGMNFSRATALASHEKIHNAKLWSMPIECEYCDKQFQDSNYLASHQTTCAKKLMLSNGNNPNGKWSKHACSECGKKFTTKQKMFRHQWIHRKKTHSCEVCGGQYEKQNQLDEHRLSAHPGVSPFTCSECGKSFVSRQGLWEHSRAHGGSPVHFQCDTCSKTFSSRQGYLIHHRTHTGERPYGCKFCWKAFRDGGTLRKHERIHTGERPHVCPLCSRAFNQKVVLREHVRWVHAAGKNDTEVIGPPFPCPLCGALNQDRDELCAHIVKHSDQMIAEAKAKNSNIDSLSIKSVEKKCKVGRGKKSQKMQMIDQGQGQHLIQGINGETIVFVSTDGVRVGGGEEEEEEEEEKKEEEQEDKKKQVIVENINALRVQFIDDKEDSTLKIISKENETLPEAEEFGEEIETIDEGIYQESQDERKMELICGICGDEFEDKNILMDHVKIHI